MYLKPPGPLPVPCRPSAADSSPFPLASSQHPALNNKYERVLREYPEGAISGVQARALGLTLSHTWRPSLFPSLPRSSSASTSRNASLIHLETRRAVRLWKKGEGPSDRFMETAAFLSSLFLFFSFLFWYWAGVESMTGLKFMKRIERSSHFFEDSNGGRELREIETR